MTAEPGVLFRLGEDRLHQLRAMASELGISTQAYLELKIFGEIAPRKIHRRDAIVVDQQERLIA